MNSTEYANHILNQLMHSNDSFCPPPLNEMQKRNAGAAMKEIIAQRLSSNGSPIENHKGSRFVWSDGIVLNRNSRVGLGFWSSMPSSQILSLQQTMAGKPGAFLFCHFDVENGSFHVWAIPNDLAIKAFVTIPDGQLGSKTLFIEVGKHRFKNAGFSPDLEPFYRKINLSQPEKESLSSGVKQDQAAKELANASDAVDSNEDETQIDDEDLYSEATVAFVSALPLHTLDKAWHQQNRDVYRQVLRQPTSALIESLRNNYIEELDSGVANTSKNISVLNKNDYGRGGYYQHLWAAFYDPDSGSKTKSCQLFIILFGIARLFRYGFSFGNYCQSYIEKLHQAIAANRSDVVAYLNQAPPGVIVSLSEAEDRRTLTSAEFAALLTSTNETTLTGNEPISVYREFSLDELPQKATTLADEVGEFFRWVWPFFQASRTGIWTVADRLVLDDPEDEINGVPIDEDAPRTLVELSERSSLPISKLRQMEEALLTKQQIILTGPPGTSKTYIAQLFARYFVADRESHPQGTNTLVFMHANWGYEDFFEGIRPVPQNGNLSYESRLGCFLKWIESLRGLRSDTRHVMVIDEINRCDTAAVLGELLQLFEYRGRSVELLSGRKFRLPSNVYIIGTMNSADRSIGRMDLALRRRFLWLELFPDYEVLQKWLGKSGNNKCGFSSDLLRQCNQLLEEQGIQPDQQIGHALFMIQTFGNESQASQDKPLVAEALRRIVLYSVVPYVSELCMMQLGRIDFNLVAKIQQKLLSCLNDSSLSAAGNDVESNEP
jgi:hypothetical protein